jgi:hypothetical protein
MLLFAVAPRVLLEVGDEVFEASASSTQASATGLGMGGEWRRAECCVHVIFAVTLCGVGGIGSWVGRCLLPRGRLGLMLPCCRENQALPIGSSYS